MTSRGELTEELNQIEQELKQLEITYEQYFMGIEKRAPERERHNFLLRMRRMIGRYIPQTDIRFRLQSITSRFNSYCAHWDRIMRLIDEGKYERHTAKIQRHSAEAKPLAREKTSPADPVDHLYDALVKAHDSCSTTAPQKAQVAKFLAKQQEAIQQKFGDRQVEFKVVTENGKPKVKVRAKR
jgi:hypothetical protein